MASTPASSEVDPEEDAGVMRIDAHKTGRAAENPDFAIIWSFLENFRHLLHFPDLSLDDLEDGFNSHSPENGNWRLFISFGCNFHGLFLQNRINVFALRTYIGTFEGFCCLVVLFWASKCRRLLQTRFFSCLYGSAFVGRANKALLFQTAAQFHLSVNFNFLHDFSSDGL